MPELDGSNIKKAAFTKFIRVNSKIFFADNISTDDHASITNRYSNGKFPADAGFLVPDKNNEGKLVAESGSITLGIEADNRGRKKTNRLLSNL